jgi:POT family proton-dependent oligopeptide transporter
MLIYYRLYWVTYNQINGNLNSQAKTMMLHGVPNDILQNLDPFAIMILVPLMDFVMYPMLRKSGINFTPIKRITAGFMLGSAAMIWAAVVQYYM